MKQLLLAMRASNTEPMRRLRGKKSMTAESFLDANVLLYACSNAAADARSETGLKNSP